MGLEPTLNPPDLEVIWQRIPLKIFLQLSRVLSALLRFREESDRRGSNDRFTGTCGTANELQGPRGLDGDEVEFWVMLPDGTLKYVRWYGHPILDKTGQFVEFVGTAMDVTEHKKAEFERENPAVGGRSRA